MRALILVDLQNDFVEGGALAVSGGRATIEVANAVIPAFECVVATQDWHPADHQSFASAHPGRSAGERVDLHGLPQVLWPTHCVQGEFGAEFVAGLKTQAFHHIVQKGVDPTIDSYSGFYDNGHRRSTGLAEWLRAQGIDEVWVMGLATDYCVKFTALDAVAEGFRTVLIEDGCRAVNLAPDDGLNAVAELQAAGVHVLRSTDV